MRILKSPKILQVIVLVINREITAVHTVLRSICGVKSTLAKGFCSESLVGGVMIKQAWMEHFRPLTFL